MSTLTISATFTQSAGDAPATGLTLTDIDLYLTAVKKTDGARTVIWNGSQHPSAEVDNVGAYIKQYTSADLDTYDYFAAAIYTGSETLDADSVNGAATADHQGVWTYATRTLTQAAASVTAAVSGSDLTIHRGDTFVAALTDIGDISDRTKLWFTVKSSTGDADSEALVQIEETAGLLYINGAAAATAANGSISVSDENDGDLTITLDEAETYKLSPSGSLSYDIQILTSAGVVTTKTSGEATVTADVTRVIT